MRIRSRSSAGAKGAERELKDLVSLPENGNRCGECGSAVPTWCSINLGVFLCGRCASVHRKVFSLRDDDAYSDVKSLSLDRWSERDLDDLSRSGGNKHNNELWNPKEFPFRLMVTRTRVLLSNSLGQSISTAFSEAHP